MPACQPPPVPSTPPAVPPSAPRHLPAAWLTAVDAFVFRMYRTGFVQSLILHVVAILVLALIVIRPDLPRPAKLTLDFTAAGSEPEPDDATLDLPAFAAEELPAEDAAPLPLADLPLPEAEIELDAVEPAVFTIDAEADAPEAAALNADVAVPAAARGQPVAAAAAPAGGGGGGAAIGGEVGRRLAAAGAGTGDVQISIAWNNVNDIDLHVLVEPLDPGFGPSIINFANRVGVAGGCLDVDRNAHPNQTTDTPVENVFWGKGRAPYGRFTVAVHHYRDWGGKDPTEVEVVVLVDGEEERFRVALRPGNPLHRVTSFRRVPKPGMQVVADSAVFPAIPRPVWRPVPNPPAGWGGGGGRPAPRMIPLKPSR